MFNSFATTLEKSLLKIHVVTWLTLASCYLSYCICENEHISLHCAFSPSCRGLIRGPFCGLGAQIPSPQNKQFTIQGWYMVLSSIKQQHIQTRRDPKVLGHFVSLNLFMFQSYRHAQKTAGSLLACICCCLIEDRTICLWKANADKSSFEPYVSSTWDTQHIRF